MVSVVDYLLICIIRFSLNWRFFRNTFFILRFLRFTLITDFYCSCSLVSDHDLSAFSSLIFGEASFIAQYVLNFCTHCLGTWFFFHSLFSEDYFDSLFLITLKVLRWTSILEAIIPIPTIRKKLNKLKINFCWTYQRTEITGQISPQKNRWTVTARIYLSGAKPARAIN